MKVEQKNCPPNSVLALVLMIISFYIPFGGFILSIIALVLSNNSLKAYNENPGMYRSKMIPEATRVMSIIGICFNIALTVALIVIISLGVFSSIIPFLSDLDLDVCYLLMQ
jgi:hypothetical protein